MATPQLSSHPSLAARVLASRQHFVVRGYGCRLFRDDELAQQVDNGRFLQPWCGDPSLLMDRCGGRPVGRHGATTSSA